MNVVRLCPVLTAFLLTTTPSLADDVLVPGYAIMVPCKSSLNGVATPSAETSCG
ncbi:MAG: hypothetical protein QOD25_839 [Alphaproteobacteria bacterium]|jgi:hypothetical protein|nr:hypothetical protein [Alphaproteobacteria bacterium]